MTPADVIVRWPSAREIWRAVEAAAELEGEDAIEVFLGTWGMRARVYAFLAVAHEYPTCPRAALGRKFGDEKLAGQVRAKLRAGRMAWFSLQRLNEVRAACRWWSMTAEQAEAATLLYCGRSFEEFLPGGSDAAPVAGRSGPDEIAACGPDASPLSSWSEDGRSNSEAGSGGKEKPAQIESSKQDGEGLPPPSGKGPRAGAAGEMAPAIVQGSDGRTDGRALKGQTGSLREDNQATGAQRSAGSVTHGLKRPSSEDVGVAISAQAADDANRRPRQGGCGAGVEPGPSDLRAVRATVDKTAVKVDETAASVDKSAENPVLVAPEIAQPKHAQKPPSPRAAALAQATREMAAKPARRSSFGGLGGLGLTGAVELNYRPDAPAEQRGCVVVTAELMGDPTPEQRERMKATPGVAVPGKDWLAP